MKALVTGSAGHLGEAMVRSLQANGHPVLGLDILDSPFTHRLGSITDGEFVRQCMDGVGTVYHTATLHKPHVATHSPPSKKNLPMGHIRYASAACRSRPQNCNPMGMYRNWFIGLFFLSVAATPLASFAQHAFDDLPGDDPSKRSALTHGQDAAKKIRENIFIIVSVDPPACYAGQQVQLSYHLYTALQSTSTVTAKPLLNGFTVKERTPADVQLPERTIDGRRYQGFTVWQALLTPLQAGDYTIDPLTVSNEVSYLRADGKTARYSGPVTSKKTTLHVLALPNSGRPTDFTGLVGEWKIRSRLAFTTPAADESDTLFVEVTGAGNFDGMAIPAIHWPSSFRRMEPVQRWELNDNSTPQSGRKTVAFPFIPTQAGAYSLPAIDITWFDPSVAAYRTAQTNPLLIQVTRAAMRSPGITPPIPAAVPASPSFLSKLVFPLVLLVLTILFLVRRASRLRRAIAAHTGPQPTTPPLRQAQPPAPEILTPGTEKLQPLTPKALTSEPLTSEPLPPMLPEEEQHLAIIKQSLIGFLQARLNTETWQEEELLRLVREQEPVLAEKASPLLELCNRLLYSPHRPEPALMTELHRRLEGIVNT